jgi:DNA-binding protein
MEIPDRDQHEAELLALLLLLFDELTADLIADRIVPWQGYIERVRVALANELAAVYVLAVLVTAAQQGITADTRELTGSAITWAVGHASAVANRLIARIQTGFLTIRNALLPRAARDEQIRNLANRSTAEGIVVTEITTARVAGQTYAVQLFQRTTGLVLEGIWQCVEDSTGKPDSRVCPICRPLHDKPKAIWGNLFPLGPPAHPRCRCTLSYQP